MPGRLQSVGSQQGLTLCCVCGDTTKGLTLSPFFRRKKLIHKENSYPRENKRKIMHLFCNTEVTATTLPKLISLFSLNSPNASDLGQQTDFEQPKQLSGLRIVSLQELRRTKPKGRSMW